MPTFNGQSEERKTFGRSVPNKLKFRNHLTEGDKKNNFHSLMRGDALQTLKTITSFNKKNLGETLTAFRQSYVKPQSIATAKHKVQRLVFKPANQKLKAVLNELQKLAKDAFGVRHSGDYSAIPICQNVYPPEKIEYLGAFGEWHI